MFVLKKRILKHQSEIKVLVKVLYDNFSEVEMDTIIS